MKHQAAVLVAVSTLLFVLGLVILAMRRDAVTQSVLTDVEFKRAALDDGTIVVNARSRRSAGRYGVSFVPAARTATLGYEKRVVGYKRKSVVEVPAVSPDTRRCDAWNTSGDPSKLVKCDMTAGTEACFRCMESREFVRVCVHLEFPLPLYLSDDEYLVMPANSAPTEGYCLPRSFERISHDNDGNWRPADERRNCNPHTGDWLLSRLNAEGDSSYNWICRCRYPNLMTNVDTILSDCMRPVGCRPHGRLDDDTSNGKVNPYTDGKCVCDEGYEPGRDSTIGPVCLPSLAVGSSSLPQRLYPRFDLDLGATLSWPGDQRFLDGRLATVFGESKEPALLPNPCAYDAVTARRIPAELACGIESSELDGTLTAYCVTRTEDCLAVRTDRDYLRGNNGQFANACMCVHGIRRGKNDPVNHLWSYQNTQVPDSSWPDYGAMYAFEPNSPTLALIQRLKQSENYDVMASRLKPALGIEAPMQDYSPVYDSWRDWASVYEEAPVRVPVASGRKRETMDRWQTFTDRKDRLVVYNTFIRGRYWTVVKNPFSGYAHWEKMTMKQFDPLIILRQTVYPAAMDAYHVNHRGMLFEYGQERPLNFSVHDDNHVRHTIRDRPIYYPCDQFMIPFYTGGYDDERFSLEFYPTIYPIFQPEKREANDERTPRLPFLFNAGFDVGNCYLSMHELGGRMYLSAEPVVMTYRDSDEFMKRKLQGRYV